MKHTTHPGDFLWIVAGGRMVAMTHGAYDAARRIVELQRPDAYEQLRAHGRGTGELYKLALGILEREGELRVELHAIPQRDDIRVPVYAVATSEPAEPDPSWPAPRAHRPKQRYRRKRAPAAPPVLAVVGGTAAE